MCESVDCLLAENAKILRDLAELVTRLDDDAFTSPADPCYGSTIGQQVRHAIEHGEALLAAPCGSVDFHGRERDPATETIRALAHRRLSELTEHIEEIRRGGLCDFALKVRHVVDGRDGRRDCWLDSSLSRELAFLQSHSIHHMALIGMMASLRGVSVPVGFGVARQRVVIGRHRRVPEAGIMYSMRPAGRIEVWLQIATNLGYWTLAKRRQRVTG